MGVSLRAGFKACFYDALGKLLCMVVRILVNVSCIFYAFSYMSGDTFLHVYCGAHVCGFEDPRLSLCEHHSLLHYVQTVFSVWACHYI